MPTPSNMALRIASCWIVEQRLRKAADEQLQVRTPGGKLVGLGPDNELTARWLSFLMSMTFQAHDLADMTVSGESAETFLWAALREKPEGQPIPGTGYINDGVWLTWNGVSWVKGTPPSSE